VGGVKGGGFQFQGVMAHPPGDRSGFVAVPQSFQDGPEQ
jgi:hypothetical protein